MYIHIYVYKYYCKPFSFFIKGAILDTMHEIVWIASVEREAIVVGIVCLVVLVLFVVAGVKQILSRND